MKPGRQDKGNDDAKPASPRHRRAVILIVDDEEVIAATLKEFLQGEGFEVATAHDLAVGPGPGGGVSSRRSSSATCSSPGPTASPS